MEVAEEEEASGARGHAEEAPRGDHFGAGLGYTLRMRLGQTLRM